MLAGGALRALERRLGAVAGDSVVLAGGTYSGPKLTIDKGLTLRALDPADRPSIVQDGSNPAIAVDITAGSVSVSDIDITSDANPLAVEQKAGSVTIARCRLLAGANGVALYVDGQMVGGGPTTTITDSALHGQLYTGFRPVSGRRLTIVVDSGIAMRNFEGNSITIDDSIVMAGPGSNLSNHGTQSGTIAVRHSYVSSTGDLNDSTGDVIGSTPAFRDPAHNDFHLLPGSPAVAAGDSAAPVAPDLDGYTRVAPIDLGAYAFRVPSIPQAPTAEATSPTEAVLTGHVNGADDRGTASFEITGPNGFSQTTTTKLIKTAATPTLVVPIGALAPNTTYTVTLSVNTLGGFAQAAPIQFTTPPLAPTR